MATSYDDAVAELYQTPHTKFVEERKRLAGELKTTGDKLGATRFGKLPRPPISAWVVNQLWWHARDGFDSLLATAARLREGDLAATAAHRDALTKLRARAAMMLTDAGNAATEATLRRVATTLSAIAANGGFDPDPPGALGADRDLPGFEAVGIVAPAPRAAGVGGAASAAPADEPRPVRPAAPTEAEVGAADAAEQRAQAEVAAERRRAEQDRAKRLAERHRIEAALRTAKGDVERRTKDVDRLRQAVTDAEAAVENAQAAVDDLEATLAALPE